MSWPRLKYLLGLDSGWLTTSVPARGLSASAGTIRKTTLMRQTENQAVDIVFVQ